MKKSDFIKKVLKSRKNTVFVNEEQVSNSLEIFESLGMLPPYVGLGEEDDWGFLDYESKWENEDEA